MDTTPTAALKVPDVWRIAQPGEFFNSRLPLHRLEAIAAQLAQEGIVYTFEPSPNGYYCKRQENA
jgi:hypothetical protein